MKRLQTCLPAFSAWLCLLAAVPADAAPLAFRIDEGRNLNSFIRQGPVAAHLLLRSGTEPRILVAFPAGNSGVGLWFEDLAGPAGWTLVSPPQPIEADDSRRRPLHGIEFEVAIDAPKLEVRAAVLSSVRVLRDYELLRSAPAQVQVEGVARHGTLSWSRDRLDGAPGYRLEIEALDGTRVSVERFVAGEAGTMKLRVRALTGEPPLVPLESPVTSRAGTDTRSRQALAFLSYKDKFLAGSWRFNTYFGRDTLISALLLAPVLEPESAEAALSSVLDRLDPHGEVAHEEDIGEFAVLRNAREGRGKIATPVYDYGMVDDDFLLAPLAARWLLDDARGRARAKDFLNTKGAGGEARGKALARNLAWVIRRTAAFAADPQYRHLVGIKDGRTTGNWRDSEQGLGGGRYAYDVNAALVPAALEAAARLSDSKLLDAFTDEGARNALARADSQARVWSSRAPRYFEVALDAGEARTRVGAYAREIGVDGATALRAIESQPLRFHALALDGKGQPIPILHSDEGFRLLLTQPAPAELAVCLDAILRPFPAGLMSDVGLLVANPALAPPDVRREFTRFAYHGTVVWSWQQALMAAGLERQSRRADLPAPVRARIAQARTALWALIERTNELRTSELWSWSWNAEGQGSGRYQLEPFGRAGADADESNAAQLWSTVYLGLTPP